MNRGKWSILKGMNFSNRKVSNFYQQNNKNTNTLLINTKGHPAPDIMRGTKIHNKLCVK